MSYKISAEKVSVQSKFDAILKNWCKFGTSISAASVSSMPATSKYDLNQDLTLWFATDLLAFNFVENKDS